jgi:hypothetical protein
VKAPSPLLGFNNNVRHKGRVFHIQTEDSGVRHPHIITHLFGDGGRILKTTKTSYAEHIGNEKLAETVRQMMQEQHKAMFIALRDGQFDYLFDESAAGPQSQVAQAKIPPAKPSTPQAPEPAPPPRAPEPAPAAVAAPPVEVTEPPRTRVPSARPSSPTAPTEPAFVAQEAVPMVPPAAAYREPAAPPPPAEPVSRKRPAGRPSLDVDPAAIHGVASPDHAVARRTPARRDEGSIDLDLDALERAAVEAQTPFAYQQIQDLPPPPAAVLGQKRPSPGGYSVRAPAPPAPPPPEPPVNPRRSATPDAAVAARRTSPRPAPPAPPPPPPAARYAPSRPASIFATTRPQEGTSIFGEDLISEKSLDEVILSYLAEDLDAPSDKK